MAKYNIKVLKDFFGTNGGTLKDFAKEISALSDEEKVQLSDGIVDETFTY